LPPLNARLQNIAAVLGLNAWEQFDRIRTDSGRSVPRQFLQWDSEFIGDLNRPISLNHTSEEQPEVFRDSELSYPPPARLFTSGGGIVGQTYSPIGD
jgi:hypothetical protein